MHDGGNLVLTDGALKAVAYMGLVPINSVDRTLVYAGFISFTRDGQTDTFADPLAKSVDQPGAAEGDNFRHQTYEPVPIGFEIPEQRDPYSGFAPVWTIDQTAWEKTGGRTVGITTPGETVFGELSLGDGSIRVIGALLPMPSERYYHPFGLSNYSVTYTGYQVLNNVLQHHAERPRLAATGPEELLWLDIPAWGLLLLAISFAIWKRTRSRIPG